MNFSNLQVPHQNNYVIKQGSMSTFKIDTMSLNMYSYITRSSQKLIIKTNTIQTLNITKNQTRINVVKQSKNDNEVQSSLTDLGLEKILKTLEKYINTQPIQAAFFNVNSKNNLVALLTFSKIMFYQTKSGIELHIASIPRSIQSQCSY